MRHAPAVFFVVHYVSVTAWIESRDMYFLVAAFPFQFSL
jgi:hypothetical protein